MNQNGIIKGFSKLSREEKIKRVIKQQHLPEAFETELNAYLHPEQQTLFNDISENTVSNYYLPFSLAPNFRINDKMYVVPMVIEESSVVAAASKAATFWADKGGFSTKVIDMVKNGQIFFQWNGPYQVLRSVSEELKDNLKSISIPFTQNMNRRGGGIIDFEIAPVDAMPNTFQLLVKFRTADSMGANFINTCLEQMATPLVEFINTKAELNVYGRAELMMSILSNYTPECLVECTLNCPIEALAPCSGHFSPAQFARRFKTAVDIAINDPYRAVTHNKGIFNGIDAVVLATGNDFRAIEAGAQAYAARSGRYRSLTTAEISDGTFNYTLKVPLALGTVGGLTNIHPMVKAALRLLGRPSAEMLMQIVASTGMANNFSAVSALVTTGIQKGHMRLHLSNILASMDASKEEKKLAYNEFENKVVSFSAVQSFINACRK